MPISHINYCYINYNLSKRNALINSGLPTLYAHTHTHTALNRQIHIYGQQLQHNETTHLHRVNVNFSNQKCFSKDYPQ